VPGGGDRSGPVPGWPMGLGEPRDTCETSHVAMTGE